MRLASASTLPIVLDSTEPAVIEAGLERLAGRCLVNSVNYEDGDGPGSRMARIMPVVLEHGAGVIALTIDEEGQARTADWKVQVASRLIDDLTGNWGMRVDDIVVDCLTFPVTTGQEETRRDALETIEAIREVKRRYPAVQTTLGVSNVSFGVNPAARAVLNSVFLHEAVEAGLDSAIVHAARIVPLSRIPEEQLKVALDLVYDRRSEGYDPLQRLLEIFADVTTADNKADRAAELAAMPLPERLQRRIVDGERNGLTDDLDAALAEGRTALGIVNEDLLAGMKEVGELFGSGQMQLPFVLQSAEVMKAAVAHLEPHMEVTDEQGKGTIVLATVKGDVHDIGKNLVDIILTNNGYTVRQPRHQAAGQRDPRRRRRARRRRHRHVRPAGQEHRGDEGEPRGAQLPQAGRPLAGDPRRRGPHPWLRRGGPRRDLPGRGALRPRRVRGAAADGRPGGLRPGRARRHPARAAQAPGAVDRERRCRAGRGAGALRRRGRQPGADTAVLGLARGQGHQPARGRRVDRRAGDVHGPVGAARLARRRAVVRGAGRDRGPAAAADVARAGADRADDGAGGRLRLLAVLVRGRRPGGARPGDAGRRDRAVHLPAAAPRPVPVPGRLLPAQGVRRARRGRLPPGDHGRRG